MSDLLPPQIEICARQQYGQACGGVIWRPQFSKSSCWKCGSDQPGVVYGKIAITRAVKVFVDMDGVLADFDRAVIEIVGRPAAEYEQEEGSTKFWSTLRHRRPNLYETLPLMADALDLWGGVIATGHYPVILTGVPNWSDADAQKRRWANEHFPGAAVITCASRFKSAVCSLGDILIDDRPKYRDRWEEKGGIWITHTSASESLAALNKLVAA